MGHVCKYRGLNTYIKYLINCSNCAVGRAVASRLAMRDVASCRAIGRRGINLCTWSSSYKKERQRKRERDRV